MNAHKTLSAVRDGISQSKSRQQVSRIMFGTSLMLAVASVQAESPLAETGHRLEGTWVVSVDPPGPVPPTHIVFASFVRGGVFTGSPDLYLPPPIARIDPPLGLWERTGGKEFASTFVAFAYDASGQAIGTIKINSSYRLTGKDSFEGNSQLLICDLNLNCPLPGSGVATLRGTRLQIEPLVNP